MSIKSFFRRNLKKNKPIFIVDNSEELDILDEELSKAEIIGLDTEFDWRTTYFPKLSLIQIVANSKLFLIDCLKIDPSKVLKKYLESKNCLKIFHSVRSDATVLSKCLNIHSLNVFDIQVADQILSQSNIRSYGKIVKSFFGIELEKSETNSNWLKRPLASSQLVYASEDVEYLFEIARAQMKKLKKISKLKEAFEKSTEEAKMGNEDFLSMRLKKFNNKFTSLEREIFIWRENIAEKKNIPPGYIFSEKKLSKLANILRKKSYEKKEKVFKIFGDTSLSDRFLEDFS